VHDGLTEKNTQYDSQVVAGHDQTDDVFGIAIKAQIDTEQTV